MTLTNKDLKEILGLPTRDVLDVREQNTKLFSNISIETGAACNRRCAFCPQAVEPRADEWMPEEMFYEIIRQLKALRYKQRITLNSYNEPTRDTRLEKFISHIREELPRTHILINTNGDYLKGPEDIAKYFKAGLNAMQINIYSSADGTGDRKRIDKGIEKAQKRYEVIKSYVDSLEWLDQNGSIYLHGGRHGKVCQVMPKWDLQPEDVADHANTAPAIKHGTSVRNHISNRAGSIPQFVSELSEPLEKMCVRPFRAFMINWRGDAYICCNDYYGDAVFGNVMEKSIEQLFNDPRYHAYRIKLQNKDRNILLCDKCDYTGGFYQHNVQHVTLGKARDQEIINADMRTPAAAGFGNVVTLRKSK